MKHPWQIWLWLLLSLAVVFPAMVWLTFQAVRLDKAEALARHQAEEARGLEQAARRKAELEEDISLALWRMDTWLTPLLARESARPYVVYRPFYVVPQPAGKGGEVELTEVVSPIAEQPSDQVLLHFQLDHENHLTSPQCPTGDWSAAAVANGVSGDNIRLSNGRLDQLDGKLDFAQLWAALPAQHLSPVELNEMLDVKNAGQSVANTQPLYQFNDLGLAQVKQQLRESQQQLLMQQNLAPNAAPLQQDAQTTNAPRQPGASNEESLPPNAPASQPQAPNPTVLAPNPTPQAPNATPPQQAAGTNYSGEPRYGQAQGERVQFLRGGIEFDRRNRVFQSYAQREVADQRQSVKVTSASQTLREGISRPLWISGELFLARRVNLGEESLVQGCWLDWPKLKQQLLAEVADLLPAADLVPVTGHEQVSVSRVLATLPVRLVVPELAVGPLVSSPAAPSPFSPIRISLWIAWTCLLLASGAAAALLLGVVTLSERRAAFVSAVTHELRTPLTTFRMYAEMLSAGMVPPPQQATYLDTLRVEGDRLWHLVENVLAYARLERGRRTGRRERVTLGELIRRAGPRLTDRAAQAGMQLVVENPPAADAVPVMTDPAAVEQILFNLVDNACKYAAEAEDRRIHLTAFLHGQTPALRVADHGPGISRQVSRRLFRPFSKSVHEAAHTAPGVGLGLALCRRLASELGGRLDWEQSAPSGASFLLRLPRAE